MLNRIVALARNEQVGVDINQYEANGIQLSNIPHTLAKRLLELNRGEAIKNLNQAPEDIRKECREVALSLQKKTNGNPYFTRVTHKLKQDPLGNIYFFVVWVVQLNAMNPPAYFSIFGAKKTQKNGREFGSVSVPGSMVTFQNEPTISNP